MASTQTAADVQVLASPSPANAAVQPLNTRSLAALLASCPSTAPVTKAPRSSGAASFSADGVESDSDRSESGASSHASSGLSIIRKAAKIRTARASTTTTGDTSSDWATGSKSHRLRSGATVSGDTSSDWEWGSTNDESSGVGSVSGEPLFEAASAPTLPEAGLETVPRGAPGLELKSQAPEAPASAFLALAQSVFTDAPIKPKTSGFRAKGFGGVPRLKKDMRGWQRPAAVDSTCAVAQRSVHIQLAKGDPSSPPPACVPVAAQAVPPKGQRDKFLGASRPEPSPPFDPKAFRRELSALLAELRTDGNVGNAVLRIRRQAVPVEHQAGQFVDLLTRAAEYTNKPARRSAFAVAAGLAATQSSPFDRSACLAGVGTFFREVYWDLCKEVPSLPGIARCEMVPTLRSVLSTSLDAAVPLALCETFGCAKPAPKKSAARRCA